MENVILKEVRIEWLTQENIKIATIFITVVFTIQIVLKLLNRRNRKTKLMGIDFESRTQLDIIEIRGKTDQSAKELELLKTQISQIVKLCGDLTNNTERRLEKIEKLFDALNKQINATPSVNKPSTQANLLDTILKLFKRK